MEVEAVKKDLSEKEEKLSGLTQEKEELILNHEKD